MYPNLLLHIAHSILSSAVFAMATGGPPMAHLWKNFVVYKIFQTRDANL